MPESTSSSTRSDPHLWVTILAGGSGTRFWPASTPSRPKQLLALAGKRPLIQETLERARSLAPESRIRILTGSHLLAPFREVLGELDPSCFLVEPSARGTAPVLTWAAWVLFRSDPDAVMISLHADHDIQPLPAFSSLMRAGSVAARTHDLLLTVAVPPIRPETGYGYIRPGEPLQNQGGAEIFRVRSFVEKPDRETAHRYVEEGYLWNSGIFLWKASFFLQEVQRVAPEIGDLIPRLEQGDVAGFFQDAPVISVDKAVLERSDQVASIRATFQWDDVGSWEALARTQEKDPEGNILLGDARAVDARENIVMAEDGTAVLFGVENLVVVRSGTMVLVTRRDKTPRLKELLQALPEHLKDPP